MKISARHPGSNSSTQLLTWKYKRSHTSVHIRDTVLWTRTCWRCGTGETESACVVTDTWNGSVWSLTLTYGSLSTASYCFMFYGFHFDPLISLLLRYTCESLLCKQRILASFKKSSALICTLLWQPNTIWIQFSKRGFTCSHVLLAGFAFFKSLSPSFFYSIKS